MIRRLLCVLMLACFGLVALGPSGVVAQGGNAAQIAVPSYGIWERAAERAQGVLDAGQASNEELDVLRRWPLCARRRRHLPAPMG